MLTYRCGYCGRRELELTKANKPGDDYLENHNIPKVNVDAGEKACQRLAPAMS